MFINTLPNVEVFEYLRFSVVAVTLAVFIGKTLLRLRLGISLDEEEKDWNTDYLTSFGSFKDQENVETYDLDGEAESISQDEKLQHCAFINCCRK